MRIKINTLNKLLFAGFWMYCIYYFGRWLVNSNEIIQIQWNILFLILSMYFFQKSVEVI